MGGWGTIRRVVRGVVPLCLLLAVFGVVRPVIGQAAEEASIEYAVKGAFLYKFGAFVSWPDTAFASDESPLNLCVVGPDPFGGALDEAVSGQKIADRDVQVLRLHPGDPETDCHILYIGAVGPDEAATVLEAVAGSPVLTATDNRDPDAAGIVNFVIHDNRVRFQIDHQRAVRNGLTISSRLLALAVNASAGS